MAKTDFFDFKRFNTMLTYVYNTIFRRNELANGHLPILGKGMVAPQRVRLTTCRSAAALFSGRLYRRVRPVIISADFGRSQ